MRTHFISDPPSRRSVVRSKVVKCAVAFNINVTFVDNKPRYMDAGMKKEKLDTRRNLTQCGGLIDRDVASR